MLDKPSIINDDNDSLSNTFDQLIPRKETTVSSAPFNDLRIIIDPQYRKNYQYDCENDNQYAQFIFLSLAQLYRDIQNHPEKHAKSTPKAFSKALIAFLPWLNFHKITHLNKYQIIKDFETYRINEVKVKARSSMADRIIQMLKLAIPISPLDQFAKSYLVTLVNGTRLSSIDEPEQKTVTTFFGKCLWLRPIVGDQLFNRIESPKRLMNSFVVTIASTLIVIQRSQEELESRFIDQKISALQLQSNVKSEYLNICKTGILLLKNICCISEAGFKDELSELLFHDIVKPECADYVKQKIINGEDICLNIPPKNGTKRGPLVCRVPILFDEVSVQLIAQRAEEQWRNNKTQNLVPLPITQIENVLFSYLCAWLTVQHSDIFKLTENDFRFMRNSRGNVTHFLCIYYKGRARSHKETDTLSINNVEGEAMLSFIQKRMLCPLPNNKLVEKIDSSEYLSKYSTYTHIFYLLNGDKLKSIIEKNLQQRKYTSVFMTTVSALINNIEPLAKLVKANEFLA